jgi:perosamine synthetase
MIFRFPLQYEWSDATAALRSLKSEERNDFTLPFLDLTAGDIEIFPTNRGREALYLILTNLDLKNGARIGVPLYVCSIVPKTVVAAGMTPVFIDADPETLGINKSDLEAKADTLDGLILVYTFGYPVDAVPIQKIMHGRPVIEDCAHSLGSSHLNCPLGLSSHSSFFSFGFFKPLSVGGGGCIVTKDRRLAERLTSVLLCAPSETSTQALFHIVSRFLYARAYNHPIHSMFSRSPRSGASKLPNGNGKAGDEQSLISPQLGMRKSDQFRIKTRLQSHGSEDLRVPEFWREVRRHLAPGWTISGEPSEGEWNHFMMPICAPSSTACAEAVVRLRRAGIDAARVYPHCVSETRGVGYRGDCVQAERLAQCVFSVPAHSQLSAAEQQQILETL